MSPRIPMPHPGPGAGHPPPPPPVVSPPPPPPPPAVPPPSPPPVPPTPPPGLPVFGTVPKPPITDRIIPGNMSGGVLVPVGRNSAFDYVGTRLFRGFCLHIMEGTLKGTDAYFRNEARRSALTDFGVGPDGTIYQWNTAASGRAPWANGSNGEGGEEGDGLTFIARYGANAINRDLRSIEHEGRATDRTLPEAELAATVNLMAYLADQAHVSWKDWPMLNGLPLVYGHWQFSPKSCPGTYIRSRMRSMIDQVGVILKTHQGG